MAFRRYYLKMRRKRPKYTLDVGLISSFWRLLWDHLVDFVRLMIFAYAQVCGGNLGFGVLATSVLDRVAMFPITLRVAKMSQAHRRAMQKLQPELARIREKFKWQPERVAVESQKLLKRHNISPVPFAGCLGAVAQMPIFLAVFSAVRSVVRAGGKFLWIKNIAKPDVLLTCIVAAITFASVFRPSMPEGSPQNAKAMMIIPVVITVFVLAKSSAGIGIYWGVSATAGAIQSYLIRRSAAQAASRMPL